MTMSRKLQRLSDKIYRTPSGPQVLGQKFAWVFAFTEKGRKVCDGPFPLPIGTDTAPVEAEASLAEFPSGEIFILTTKDMTRAKAEIKHRLLERGENPDEVLKRVLKKTSYVAQVEKAEQKKRDDLRHKRRLTF